MQEFLTPFIVERSTEEIKDLIDTLMNERQIGADLMELMLYKNLSYVQSLKSSSLANLYIQDVNNRNQQNVEVEEKADE